MERPVNVVVVDRVAQIELNRPAAFNALTLDTVKELLGHLLVLGCDAQIRGIVLTGAGKAFSAGGDINRALAHPLGPPAAFREMATHVHACVLEMQRIGKPIVAAINGVAAAGGLSLALACDYRLMARGATLRQAFTSQGLSIGGGATFLLPRLVGLARAMEIAVLDEPISAEQALAWNLVREVTEDGEVVPAAMTLARRLAERSSSSFASSKALLGGAFDVPLEAHLERERDAFVASVSSPDGREGLRAFAEKRRPDFSR